MKIDVCDRCSKIMDRYGQYIITVERLGERKICPQCLGDIIGMFDNRLIVGVVRESTSSEDGETL